MTTIHAGQTENSPAIHRWVGGRKQIASPFRDERRTPMHSFVSCLMHCVFSTKERRQLITPEVQQRLYPYLGGIARENKMKALSIGGVEDHVHALLSIPSALSIAKAVHFLKVTLLSGFTIHFPTSVCLNGRRVMEPSALLALASKIQSGTFNLRKNITNYILSRTN